MVAFLRQFLVVLLVLLQNAAPLVHAHTGGDSSQRGFHLHEFETLRLVADSQTLVSGYHAVDAENCIVNVGSAIKQAPHKPSLVAIAPFDHAPGFAVARDADLVNFSPQISAFIPKPPASHNGSRAPPI